MATGVERQGRVAKRRLRPARDAAGTEQYGIAVPPLRACMAPMLPDLSSLAALFAPIAHAEREMAVFAYLGRDGALLGLRHIAGARDHLALPIRAIAIDALGFDAWAVARAHNHPSGDPTPSENDFAVTRRIARGLDTIGIRLIDHVVLAGDARTSLREAGYL